MDEKEFAGITEVIRDAESCARLSQWEEEFCPDMRGRLASRSAATPVSDAQWRVIRRIQEKVYA